MVNSVYIHIPFCNDICSYCDFCKMIYNSKMVDDYLNQLEYEIKDKYNNDIIKTIYIGGGTPSSLSLMQLKRLFDIIKIFRFNLDEFTIECNVCDIDEEKLKLFKNNGVNRISLGIQTLNDNFIKLLNRHHNKLLVKEKVGLIKKYFDNINVDLIYAIPGQTLEELDNDLEFILKLDVNHISTYSLIIEEHTKLYIKKYENIDDELDYSMFRHICKKFKKYGFIHYEISNFAKNGYESKHNLVYWNNLEYYGFGLGACGYINNIRYENTRSLNKYLNGFYESESHKLDFNERMENEFILGLRKIHGINKLDFFNKYNIDIESIDIVKRMLNGDKLIDDGEYIFINEKNIYTSNDILIEFIH